MLYVQLPCLSVVPAMCVNDGADILSSCPLVTSQREGNTFFKHTFCAGAFFLQKWKSKKL